MSQLLGTISRAQQGSTGGGGSGNPRALTLNTLGHAVVMDWRTKVILDGVAYQVKLGNLSAPVTGDGSGITNVAAELAADAASGTTIIPLSGWVSRHDITGDASEVSINSVATASTNGTAFTPLPLRSDGPASVTTARAQATGAVTVTADVITTTATHYNAHGEEGGTPATDTTQPLPNSYLWEPLAPPVLVGSHCLYIAVAIMTYFAALNYAEFDSDTVSR